MNTDAIVTIPPYAPFIDEVIGHPIVSGVRLNTVMPIKGELVDTLGNLKELVDKEEKKLWIDLKCRQLRVKTFGVPPFTEIELTHNLEVETPVTAYFSDGRETAEVLKVDGNRLIMQEGPQRVVGPGESVNILHPSLKIDGYLTERDREYIAAAKELGLHHYMLSFVEQEEDIEAIREIDPDAEVVAKIESLKGLRYIDDQWSGSSRIMAARGDLYVEVRKPHHITRAMEYLISKDEKAIVASRIFPSFAYSLEPSCSDIGDVDNLLRMGYRSFMLGDDVCMKREPVLSSLALLGSMAKYYD